MVTGCGDVTHSGRPRRECRERSRRVALEKEVALEAEEAGDLAGRWASKLAESFETVYAAPSCAVVERKASSVDAEALRRDGFEHPIVVRGPDKPAGLCVPESISVPEVCRAVGKYAEVEVLNAQDQESAGSMTLDEWNAYWHSERRHTYNIITLEISNSRLGSKVKAPGLVDELDWTMTVGPRSGRWGAPTAREEKGGTVSSKSGKAALAKKRKVRDESLRRGRPTVQKYCLMSVAGCYTDFHLDFGGTSVWYHVSRGTKVFYVAPPTPANLADFERWSRSQFQASELLADRFLPRRELSRVELRAGDTLFLPGGWVHAVATPVDSVVFGGNWLHHLSVRPQMKVADLEDRVGVLKAARMPFFDQILWYAGARFAAKLAALDKLLDDQNDLAVNTAVAKVDDNEIFEPRFAARRFVLGGARGLEAARYLSLVLRSRLETRRLIVGEHVPVDLISPRHLLDALDALLDGRRPNLPRPDWLCQLPPNNDNKHLLVFVPGEEAPVANLYLGPHEDICIKCKQPGHLLCCDFCPTVQHPACNDTERRAEDDERLWACSECRQCLADSTRRPEDIVLPLPDAAHPCRPWWLPVSDDRESWCDSPKAKADLAKLLRRLRKWKTEPVRRPTVPRTNSVNKRRRRCHDCDNCRRTYDCGKCSSCRDKPRFGGRGQLMTPCERRRCLGIESLNERPQTSEAVESGSHAHENVEYSTPVAPPPFVMSVAVSEEVSQGQTGLPELAYASTALTTTDPHSASTTGFAELDAVCLSSSQLPEGPIAETRIPQTADIPTNISWPPRIDSTGFSQVASHYLPGLKSQVAEARSQEPDFPTTAMQPQRVGISSASQAAYPFQTLFLARETAIIEARASPQPSRCQAPSNLVRTTQLHGIGRTGFSQVAFSYPTGSVTLEARASPQGGAGPRTHAPSISHTGFSHSAFPLRTASNASMTSQAVTLEVQQRGASRLETTPFKTTPKPPPQVDLIGYEESAMYQSGFDRPEVRVPNSMDHVGTTASTRSSIVVVDRGSLPQNAFSQDVESQADVARIRCSSSPVPSHPSKERTVPFVIDLT